MNSKTVLTVEKEMELLEIEEDLYNDIKSYLIEPFRLSHTISAMANACGGDIYVGISEDTRSKKREIKGFNSIEDANKHIQMLDSLEGLRDNYSVSYLQATNKTYILQITVFKTATVVKSTDDLIYIRKGAQNLKCVDDDKIRSLEIDKGIFPYENEIVSESDIQDAVSSQIYDMFSSSVIPNIEKYTWLRTQKLCKDSNLNVAGTLLFTDEPQIVLPKRSAIKIYRYRTSGEGTRETMHGDPITIEGCLYNQIFEAVNSVKTIIETMKKLDDKLSSVKYPESALHEIITNAVLHRNYSITKDIHIRIFDNRVEVESPGKLAGHITVSNILSEQFARNPKIVRLINKFPVAPNKDVGEGLNTAFKAMAALKLKQPIISETDTSVIVTLRHEKLASPEETVLEYLKNHDEITNSIGRSITGIDSENTMKRVFWKLRDADLIEQIPGRRGSNFAWRLIGTTVDNEDPQMKFDV